MDLDYWFDMPGGDSFEDVTALFDQAAREMLPGETILSEGFTLLDSMGAFEIGEPRMDSGMILESDLRPHFEPLTPISAEEVCWIIDRSFACEMEWHAGSTLSQSVHTLLYVHDMAAIDPDFLLQVPMNSDPQRPLGLIAIVLRAALMGMLKCCDLAWRELSKGRVIDTEDWQGEKCEVSMLEGVPSEYVVQRLDLACSWLHSSSVPIHQRDALINRLLLRKTLLEVFRLDISQHKEQLRPLLDTVLKNLHGVQETAPSIPQPDSPALLAIDPRVNRRLPNFIPIRIIHLPTQAEVWKALKRLIDGWYQVDHLLNSSSLLAWENTGAITNWSPRRPVQHPYIRSVIQTCFSDKNLIAYTYHSTWLVDRFWTETIGILPDSIYAVLQHGARDYQSSLREVERHIGRMMVQRVRSYWFNPPRRRRFLMNSLPDYLSLYEFLKRLTSQRTFKRTDAGAIANAIPLVPVLRQSLVALDIILSGFQQELYARDERPVAYWYAAQAIELHLSAVGDVKPIIPTDSYAYTHIEFSRTYHEALQMICTALCGLTAKHLCQPKDRIYANFRRRYKWLFTKTFPDNQEVKVIPLPDLDQFFSELEELYSDPVLTVDSLMNAKNRLLDLTEMNVQNHYAPAHIDFVRTSIELCEQLLSALQSETTVSNADGNDINASAQGRIDKRLRWDPAVHPWLPCLTETT